MNFRQKRSETVFHPKISWIKKSLLNLFPGNQHIVIYYELDTLKILQKLHNLYSSLQNCKSAGPVHASCLLWSVSSYIWNIAWTKWTESTHEESTIKSNSELILCTCMERSQTYLRMRDCNVCRLCRHDSGFSTRLKSDPHRRCELKLSTDVHRTFWDASIFSTLGQHIQQVDSPMPHRTLLQVSRLAVPAFISMRWNGATWRDYIFKTVKN